MQAKLASAISCAAVALLLWPVSAGAGTLVPPGAEPQETHASLRAEPSAANLPDANLPDTIDPQVWELFDELSPLAVEPAKVVPRRRYSDLNAPVWDHAEQRDGTTHIAVKKPLPLTWDTRIGADLNRAGPPVYDPAHHPLPFLNDRNTAAAWAKVAVPRIAAVEVRMNSEPDQSRLGATLSRSVPLGEQYAVTFQNSFVLSEPIGPATPAVSADRIFSTDRLVKFDILGSGTTLAAGATTSSVDNTTRAKLIAEQNIYGPLNVTTTLTDIGTPTEAKSVSAGLKLNW